MNKTIQNIISSCDIMKSVKVEGNCLYFCGPFPRSSGMRHIMVIMDIFTKFVQIYILRTAITNNTIKCLDIYLEKFGKVKRVQTDHGTQFNNRQWIE